MGKVRSKFVGDRGKGNDGGGNSPGTSQGPKWSLIERRVSVAEGRGDKKNSHNKNRKKRDLLAKKPSSLTTNVAIFPEKRI